MIKSSKAETIVWILIWVFIISIVILWISNLINYSRVTILSYERTTKISILRENLTNIIKSIDISWIKENEIFYVYKNNTSKNYEIFTWSTYVEYKYIDAQWEKVNDIINYQGDIYSRLLWVEREDTSIENSNKLIRASIKRLIKK